MKFKYHYDDNESGDEIPPLNPCDGAQQPAGTPDRLPCPAPYFETVTHTGSVTNVGPPARFPFVPIPGFPVSFNCGTNDFIQLTLFAPDGTTVLATEGAAPSFQESGVDTSYSGSACQLVYTFPDASTYFIEVETTGDPLANFELIISPGAFGGVSIDAATDADQYVSIYVPETKRIFVLCALDTSPAQTVLRDVVVNVFDSVSMSLIARTLLISQNPTTPKAFLQVARCLFYNPTDNSVWCFEIDGATGAGAFIDRLHATTGALIEHAAWGSPETIPTPAMYSAVDNVLYGWDQSLSSTRIQVFDCAARAFLPDIIIPSYNHTGPLGYDAATGTVYAVAENPNNVFRTLYGLRLGAIASTVTLSANLEMSSTFLLFHNGKLYGSQGGGTAYAARFSLKSADVVTGTVTILSNGGQYRINSIAYDACRDCLAIGLDGSQVIDHVQSAVASAARFSLTGTIIEAAAVSILASANNFFWNNCIFNPDINRVVIVTDSGMFRL